MGRNEFIEATRNSLPLAKLAGNLYYYDRGVYVAGAEEEIGRRLWAYCQNERLAWTKGRFQDVLTALLVLAPSIENPSTEIVNFRNGIFDLKTGQLKPHSPEYLTCVQINATYGDSDDSSWDAFIRQVFPEDSVDFAYELIGFLMVPLVLQKAIVLFGEGSNGKSLFLEALIDYLGTENVSALDIQAIENDRFALSGLLGKIANICTDLPELRLRKTDRFKRIVSGDTVAVEVKYNRAYHEVRLFSRMVFSTNRLPEADAVSDAWFRRIVLVPFTRYFEDNPIRFTQLLKKLQSDSAKAYLAKRSAMALQQLLRRGNLSVPPICQDAMISYRGTYDTIAKWIATNVTFINQWFTSTDSLYDDYKNFVESLDLEPVGKISFSRRIRRYMPTAKYVHKSDCRGYLNVALKSEVMEIGKVL